MKFYLVMMVFMFLVVGCASPAEDYVRAAFINFKAEQKATAF